MEVRRHVREREVEPPVQRHVRRIAVLPLAHDARVGDRGLRCKRRSRT